MQKVCLGILSRPSCVCNASLFLWAKNPPVINEFSSQWIPCTESHQHIEAETKWPRFRRRHLKWIFLNKNVWILIKISLKFVSKAPINNNPALVQIMAWCRPGNKPLSEPMILTHISVTWPQWVKAEMCVNSRHCVQPWWVYVNAVWPWSPDCQYSGWNSYASHFISTNMMQSIQ